MPPVEARDIITGMERDDRDDSRALHREADELYERELEERRLSDERAESEHRAGLSFDAFARHDGPRPKDFDERCSWDAETLSRLNGFKPEIWEKATLEQRVETLRAAECQLASLQGREPHRVYAIQLKSFVDGLAARRAPQPVCRGIPYAWEGRAEGLYIYVNATHLESDLPHTAVQVFLHEAYHAFQHAALAADDRSRTFTHLSSKYTEVDSQTLNSWRDKDTLNEVNLTASEYHAELYSVKVVEKLYEGYWADDSRLW